MLRQRFFSLPKSFFRRGIVYRGIYLPSLSGKLQDERLEFAYLRYAHRQRQKSLMLVNSADIILKILILLRSHCALDKPENDKECPYRLVDKDQQSTFEVWIAAACVVNVILGLITWWRCYANNYLHLGDFLTFFTESRTISSKNV